MYVSSTCEFHDIRFYDIPRYQGMHEDAAASTDSEVEVEEEQEVSTHDAGRARVHEPSSLRSGRAKLAPVQPHQDQPSSHGSYLGQRGAVTEGATANVSEAGRQLNRRQRGAALEGAVA